MAMGCRWNEWGTLDIFKGIFRWSLGLNENVEKITHEKIISRHSLSNIQVLVPRNAQRREYFLCEVPDGTEPDHYREAARSEADRIGDPIGATFYGAAYSEIIQDSGSRRGRLFDDHGPRSREIQLPHIGGDGVERGGRRDYHFRIEDL